MQLRYFLPSDTSDKTSVASSKPFEPDLTIVEKAEEMTLNDTSADSSVDKDIDTIHDKLHFMSLKDQELQNRDPRKEELAQIVQKGRLGILYEQKNNKVGRKIALLPMDESISLTEKDFEENKREVNTLILFMFTNALFRYNLLVVNLQCKHHKLLNIMKKMRNC